MVRSERFECEEFRMRINLSGSSSRTGGSTATDYGIINRAGIGTEWTDNPLTTAIGASLVVESRRHGSVYPSTTEFSYRIYIPELGIDQEYNEAFSESGGAILSIEDFGIYYEKGTNNSHFMHGTIRLLRADGSVIDTWLYSDNMVVSSFITPSGVPIFGVPPEIYSNSAVTPLPAIGFNPINCSNFEATCQSTASGGVAFKIGGVWREYAVALPELLEPPAGESCMDIYRPTLSGNSSYNMSMSSKCYVKCVEGVTETVICNPCPPGQVMNTPATYLITPKRLIDMVSGSGATLFADNSNSVRILNWANDYAEYLHRAPFPESWKVARTQCCTVINPEVGTVECTGDLLDPVMERVHAPFSVYEDVVRKSDDPFFEPFGRRIWAFANWGGYAQQSVRTDVVIVEPGSCGLVGGDGPMIPGSDDPGSNACSEYVDATSWKYSSKSSTFETVLATQGESTLTHAYPAPHYNNTIACPHWACWLKFPDNVGDTQVEWRVFDQAISNLYFVGCGEQWLYGPSLDPTRQLKTRNTLISAPLLFSTSYAALESFYSGYPTSWLGIDGKFHVYDIDDYITDEVVIDIDATSCITTTDCSIAFDDINGEIVITPDVGELEISFDLDSGTFDRFPFQYPHIAKYVRQIWSAVANPHLLALQVKNMSPYGGEKVILSTSGEHVIPPGVESSYAGDWAQDHFSLLLLELGETDFGFDQKDDGSNEFGKSLPSMLDPELSQTFSLVQGRSGSKLRWSFTLDDDLPVRIKYPVLKTAESTSADRASIVPIDRLSSAVLYPKGPAFQSCRWQWWDYDIPEMLTVPLVWPWDYRQTWVDFSQTRRVVWEGRAPYTEAALCTFAFTKYRSRLVGFNSLQTKESLHSIASNTRAFHVKARANRAGSVIVTNDACQVPCLNWLPDFDRDGSLNVMTTFAQRSYTLAVGNRYIVSDGAPLHLYRPDIPRTEKWTVASTLYPTEGYFITSHAHSVENNEPYFDVVWGKRRIARVRPWHSYFASIKSLNSGFGTGNIHMAPTPQGVLFLTMQKSD